MRLDKFLKVSRLIKRRTVANEACDNGRISVNGRVVKASYDVKVGDNVAKRQALGRTGETGLAAGDHLHFGVYLGGVAVLPVEWWDAKWIDDNITPKLAGRSGDEIAAAQQGARRAAPAKRRR